MASLIGGLSIAVPAELRGLGEAHRRWGKLKWERLVQPSADIAAGARVGKELGKRIPVSSLALYITRFLMLTRGRSAVVPGSHVEERRL